MESNLSDVGEKQIGSNMYSHDYLMNRVLAEII